MRMTLLAATFAVAIAAVPASAADPAEAANKVRGSFPAPSPKVAFSVDLDVVVGGTIAGSGTLSAAVSGDSASPTWTTVQYARMGPADQPDLVTRVTSTLGADLRLLREDRWEKTPDGEEATSAERKKDSLHVVYRAPEADPEVRTMDAPADLVAVGQASALLFLRQCPDQRATYAFTAWDGQTREIAKRTIEVKGSTAVKEPALGLELEAQWSVVSGGSVSVEVFLSPEDRSFVASRVVEADLWLVRKGLVKPKQEPAFDLSKPASDAEEVGGRYVLARLLRDKDLFAACHHWPTLHAAAKATGFKGDEAEFRKQETEKMSAEEGKTWTRESAVAFAAAAREKATVRETPEGTEVRLGPPADDIAFVAKAFDGQWLIVKVGPAK